MCRSRVLMLNQKSHFYSVQLFEEEVRKTTLFIWVVLYMTNCLLKLPCVNGSADDWAALRFESVFFKYIFPFMWWRSPLSSALCCSSSSFAQPLCVSWQRRANGKLLVPLLPFCFSGFFPVAVVGHRLPTWLCETAVRISAQLCVWERRSVFAWPVVPCIRHISVGNRNRELVRCYV